MRLARKVPGWRHGHPATALDAYADDQLGDPERAEVLSHLHLCWRCALEFETLRLIKAALRSRRVETTTDLAGVRLRRAWANRLKG